MVLGVSCDRLRLAALVWSFGCCSAWLSTAQAQPHVPGYERFYAADNDRQAAGGMLLLGELNCTACHHADDALLAQIDSKRAPILDEAAARIKPNYFAGYIADVHAHKPGATMPSLFAGVSDAERTRQALALAHYLVSLHPDGPQQAYASIGGRARGERLYHTAGCAVCHGSRAEGAKPLSTDKPLGDLEAKYTLPSLASFLQDPLHVRPSGRMPSLNLTSAEARDVAAYLLPKVPEKTGLAYKYYEGTWDKLPDFSKLQPKATGEVEKIDISPKKRGDYFGLRFEGALVIDTAGEYTFHIGSDDGSRLTIDGQVVVDNDGVHPHTVKSGKMKLTKGRHLIVADVFEHAGQESLKVEYEGPGIKRQDVSAAIVAAQPETPIEPLNFHVDADLAAQGRKLFASIGCASCHQLRETADAVPIESTLSAPNLAKLTPDAGCLSATPGKGAPDYHLSDAQRKAIHAALASLAKPAVLTAKEKIHRTMTRLNCYACHQRDQIGGPLEGQLALFEGTQPEMGDEGRLPPLLDGVGGKLTAAWLAHTLTEGQEDRPYMLTRMPKFGEKNAGQLQKLLEDADKLPPLAPVEIDKKQAKIAGWTMVGNNGFGCIKCHTFGRFEATGVQSLDMTIMHKRLRPEWFRRYVNDPQSFRRGTRMPDAWPSEDGKSLLPKILDGRNDTQIQAVWTYLGDGLRARTPAGLVNDSLELIPTYEAIIYRNFIQDAGPRAIGVGYPEQYSLAFDANRLRIALLWQGAFIDASKHWSGRGQGFQGPAGQKVIKLPNETTVALLESADAAWPADDPREHGAQFRGYRLSEDRRPTFMYQVGGVHVQDFPNPVENGPQTTLVRTFTFSADKPTDNLYLLAAAGGEIKAEEDGWYDVDGQYKTRVTGGKAELRESGGRKELLVHVGLSGKSAKIIQQYDW